MALSPRSLAGLLLTLLAALAWPAAGQEAAVTRRATQLRETPGESGRSLVALPAQAAVTRLNERQGPWVRARTADGTTGWLHLFDVASATAPAARGEPASDGIGNALRGVTGLFGRAQPTQTATSASGIRGLGAEDLAQAQPDTGAVARMEALRQNDAEARAFASGAALRAVQVAPLPAPARPAGAGARAGNPESQ